MNPCGISAVIFVCEKARVLPSATQDDPKLDAAHKHSLLSE